MSEWDDVPGGDASRTWAERQVARLEGDVARLLEELEEGKQGARARYLDLVAEKRRLQGEIAELQRREAHTELEADRERQAVEAQLRRLRRQVERASRHRERPTGRRSTRSAHLLVDPDAWAVLKRTALERRTTVAGVLTQLIVAELDRAQKGAAAITSRANRRRRSPGEGTPKPDARVARLDCDDETWHRLRLAAGDIGVPLGRYLGEIVEAAAFERGWRARP